MHLLVKVRLIENNNVLSRFAVPEDPLRIPRVAPEVDEVVRIAVRDHQWFPRLQCTTFKESLAKALLLPLNVLGILGLDDPLPHTACTRDGLD